MNPKIDRDELPEIVEETARLEEEDRALVATPEAKQILRELDLPDTRIDEARRVIAKRRQERRARQRRLFLVGALVLAGLATAGTFAWRTSARDQALARITVSQATLKLGADPLPQSLARSANPEVALAVVLEHAPQGAGIDLTCEWRAADGKVRHMNRWQTKSIDRDLFPTHCRRAFGAADPAGRWSVTMKQDGRELTTESFHLE
jgi:hypothetical protein